MLEVVSKDRTSFLRSRVFLLPLIRIIGDGYIDTGRWSLSGLVADMMAEPLNFIQDHFPHLLHLINHLESEVECLGACWFI